MAVLIVLALIGNAWLIAPRRWRRRVLTPIAIAALLFAVITSPITIELTIRAMMLPLPRDVGDAATAIVVLGRGEPLRGQRVALAANLWHAKRAPRIFASGMMDAPHILYDLKYRGIPAHNLNGENCSRTTEENALLTAAVLPPQTHRKLLLVTDPAHILRSVLVFQSLGYEPIPKVSAFPKDLSSGAKFNLVRRELGGLIMYAFTGRLKLRSTEEIATSSTQVMNQLKVQNCNL